MQPPLERVDTAAVIGQGSADVAPVTVHRYAEDCSAALKEPREKLLAEVILRTVRHKLHHARREHIYPGIHKVGDDAAPVWLFDERAHEPVVVRDGETVSQRFAASIERDSRIRAADEVRVHERAQLKVTGCVPAYDKEILVAVKVPAVLHAPGGAECAVLHAVLKPYAEAAAVAEVAHDIARAVPHRRADIRKALLTQEDDYVLHHRPAEQRHHRLRRVAGDAPEPCAHSARHDNCFHNDAPFTCVSFTLIICERA